MSKQGNGKLKAYSAAAYPAVAIATPDEERSIAGILADFPDFKVWGIAAVGGLRDLRTSEMIDDKAQYPQAFSKVVQSDNTFLVLLDYQHLIRNAGAYRQIKHCFRALKARGSMLVLMAPSWVLPEEIKHDIPVIEAGLPSREELGAALRVCASSVPDIPFPDDNDNLLDAASGLTLSEAENAFALSYAVKGSFDAPRVLQEKLKLVRQSGQLEIALPASESDLGGLDGFREYFRAEVLPCMRDNQLRVRGILLLGVPGVGKSLASRVAGSLLSWPVLRCDISGLKGSLVGQSEGNMRAALKLAEAVSPCVLYLDEVEKAVGGYASSAQSDSGVTLGMVGTLLTWLQEHQSPILTIATCNDYSKLPAELTRAGRFDERFFVDLPCKTERIDIAAIHLHKFGCMGGWSEVIADLTEEWTGAEIEQLVKSVSRRTDRKPNIEVIAVVSKEIKPISRVRGNEINKLREWGRSQLRIANTVENDTRPARKVGRV